MLARKNLLLKRVFLQSQNKPHGGRHYYYPGIPGDQTQHDKYGRFQSPFQTITEGNFNIEVQQHKVNISTENRKEVP